MPLIPNATSKKAVDQTLEMNTGRDPQGREKLTGHTNCGGQRLLAGPNRSTERADAWLWVKYFDDVIIPTPPSGNRSSCGGPATSCRGTGSGATVITELGGEDHRPRGDRGFGGGVGLGDRSTEHRPSTARAAATGRGRTGKPTTCQVESATSSSWLGGVVNGSRQSQRGYARIDGSGVEGSRPIVVDGVAHRCKVPRKPEPRTAALAIRGSSPRSELADVVGRKYPPRT